MILAEKRLRIAELSSVPFLGAGCARIQDSLIFSTHILPVCGCCFLENVGSSIPIAPNISLTVGADLRKMLDPPYPCTQKDPARRKLTSPTAGDTFFNRLLVI